MKRVALLVAALSVVFGCGQHVPKTVPLTKAETTSSITIGPTKTGAVLVDGTVDGTVTRDPKLDERPAYLVVIFLGTASVAAVPKMRHCEELREGMLKTNGLGRVAAYCLAVTP